jgi:hypothetical protein
MKKLAFAAITLIYCLLITSNVHSQQSLTVPEPVKESFAKNLKDATSPNWKRVLDAYVVTYYNGSRWHDAYFTEEGEFKGIGNFLTFEFLPFMVQQTVKSHLNKYEITELYQFDCTTSDPCYYAVLKNGKEEKIIKMTPGGDISFIKKNKIKNQSGNSSRDIAKTN